MTSEEILVQLILIVGLAAVGGGGAIGISSRWGPLVAGGCGVLGALFGAAAGAIIASGL